VKITPIYNQILVRVIKEPQEFQSYNGIYLPTQTKNKLRRGIVSAVGPGRMVDNNKIIKAQCKEGATILFAHDVGESIGDGLLIMADEHVLAVVE